LPEQPRVLVVRKHQAKSPSKTVRQANTNPEELYLPREMAREVTAEILRDSEGLRLPKF